MNYDENHFELTIFDSLRASPLYSGFDDSDGSYSKGRYSKDYHADLESLAAYIQKNQPAAWQKLQKHYPGHEAAAVVANEVNN